MYCTGQTPPPSILNASFGFFALVRIFSFLLFSFYFFSFLGSAGLSYFSSSTSAPHCISSLERKIHVWRTGLLWLGFFGVVKLGGGFVFYYCTVYTFLSVPLPEQSSYLVFLFICVHTANAIVLSSLAFVEHLLV